jgi:UDPglucose 6-dehydrogenase|tara:strand:- start:217 stop:1068 length:852 start_codon:yes stop_codon:yes gene_type:complete
MKIGIIGNGFVGSAILHGFLLHAEDILIYDKDPKRSTHELEALVKNSKVIFICVPTPMFESGECDLSIVRNVTKELSKYREISEKVIVIKSTVVPGTVEDLASDYPNMNFVFNPEFLTERKARLDFINTSRIVLGSNKSFAIDIVENLYRVRFPHTKIIKTDFGTAQLIKYMANCFFATKVSFMNEMYQVCDAIGGDWSTALEGFISDGRIGNSHIDVPGHDGDFGYGGKCFPKDINAMIKRTEELGINPRVMKASWEKNKEVRKDLDWFDIPGAVSKNKKDD